MNIILKSRKTGVVHQAVLIGVGNNGFVVVNLNGQILHFNLRNWLVIVN